MKTCEQLFTICEQIQKKYNIIECNLGFSVDDLKNFEVHSSDVQYEIGTTIHILWISFNLVQTKSSKGEF